MAKNIFQCRQATALAALTANKRLNNLYLVAPPTFGAVKTIYELAFYLGATLKVTVALSPAPSVNETLTVSQLVSML